MCEYQKLLGIEYIDGGLIHKRVCSYIVKKQIHYLIMHIPWISPPDTTAYLFIYYKMRHKIVHL